MPYHAEVRNSQGDWNDLTVQALQESEVQEYLELVRDYIAEFSLDQECIRLREMTEAECKQNLLREHQEVLHDYLMSLSLDQLKAIIAG